MDKPQQEIGFLCRAADHPRETVLRAMEKTGKRAVGCFPLYTPDELVDAAGFLPVGMWGGPGESPRSGQYLQPFCCSVMRANMSQALDGVYDMLSGVLIPTFCDTLKCVAENWKAGIPNIPVFPMVYPQNVGSAAAAAYLEDEFIRIKEKLEQLAGRGITEASLVESFDRFERCRSVMREFTGLAASHPDLISAKTRHKILKSYYFMDKPEYTEILNGINEELKKRKGSRDSNPVRVVVTGLMLEPDALLNVLDANRLCIAADDLAQESRIFRVQGSREGTVLQRMARRFLDQRGDPFLCEQGKSRGKHLIEMVRQTGAAGVLIVMMKFCEPEEFDFPVYRKELDQAGIPYLYIELEQSMSQAESISTRMEGFVEVLRNTNASIANGSDRSAHMLR